MNKNAKQTKDPPDLSEYECESTRLLNTQFTTGSTIRVEINDDDFILMHLYGCDEKVERDIE